MQARIIVPAYRCAPEGHTVHVYLEGQIVSGIVAELALAEKAAELVSAPLENKIIAPAEVKKRKGRSGADT